MSSVFGRLLNQARSIGSKGDETSLASDQSTFFPQGIKTLVNPLVPAVDIVFVHGLTGDRERTWTSPKNSILWPRDLLPIRIQQARILTFGYDAYVMRRNSSFSTNRIRNHAKDLVYSLASYRKETRTESLPIIFVAHGLGGLVCKDAILISDSSLDDHLQSISICAIAVAFLGTPHHSSVLANWAKIPAKSLGILKQANVDILSVLETNSDVLSRLQDDFLALLRRWSRLGLFEVTCFYETLPMPKVGVIVPSDSAILAGYNHISLHADHRGVARFDSICDPGFLSIALELERWISHAFRSDAYSSGNYPKTLTTRPQWPQQAVQPKPKGTGPDWSSLAWL